MINIKLTAHTSRAPTTIDGVYLTDTHGDIVATFVSLATFYIVTGFKTVEAYNAWQDEQPVKFLVWKREH
jgi:hypothetical protein